MTLVEFLEARISEDEAVATAATPEGPTPYGWLDDGKSYQEGVELGSHEGADEAVVAHWRAFDPARVLAECAAKRAIMELHDHDDRECFEMHRGIYGPGWPEGSYGVEGNTWAHPSLEMQQGPCPTLRLLAAPYASHVDFDSSWAAGETTP